MGIVPEHRGQGIGSRLLTRSLKHAFERSGLIRVELEVYPDNLPAICLYAKYGFKVEGIRRKAIHIRGRYRDAMMMAIVR